MNILNPFEDFYRALTTQFVNMKQLKILLLALLLSACSSAHSLVPTPNLYVTQAGYPEKDIPLELQTTEPKLLYVTDRLAEKDKEGNLIYRSKRSNSMVVGEISVKYGNNLSWSELVGVSQSRERSDKIELSITATEQKLRFPATPLPFDFKDNKLVVLEPDFSVYKNTGEKFKALVSQKLQKANRQEIVLFVHGFNNEFEDAGLALADMWHFTGRIGVPIFYSWPAASGGLLGYFKDRESGEFTIYHLKETIRMLSEIEGLDTIHIVAHSRGTDITTSALRELVIETRAAGKDPLKTLKIKNLFLAAPDLDFGVVRQRLIAEKFGPAMGQITVYINQSDGALGISQYLMAGLRFGRLKDEGLGSQETEIFKKIGNVNFVNVKGVKGFFGHSYYREHAGALSDIAIAIRSNAKPGDTQRPLIHENGNFWTLRETYPN